MHKGLRACDRTWGKTPGTQMQHWPFRHHCIEHFRGFRTLNAPSAWNLARGFAPRTDPLDKARKHAGLRRGDVRTPAGPPWTPDPFAGLEGTLHHTAGCVASDGYDPLDLTGIV